MHTLLSQDVCGEEPLPGCQKTASVQSLRELSGPRGSPEVPAVAGRDPSATCSSYQLLHKANSNKRDTGSSFRDFWAVAMVIPELQAEGH